MNDSIRGEDLNGHELWVAEEINGLWVGTGRDQLLIRSLDIRAAIQLYLTFYPETDMIRATLSGCYRMCMPGQAAMSIVDAVLKELSPPEPGEA